MIDKLVDLGLIKRVKFGQQTVYDIFLYGTVDV